MISTCEFCETIMSKYRTLCSLATKMACSIDWRDFLRSPFPCYAVWSHDKVKKNCLANYACKPSVKHRSMNRRSVHVWAHTSGIGRVVGLRLFLASKMHNYMACMIGIEPSGLGSIMSDGAQLTRPVARIGTCGLYGSSLAVIGLILSSKKLQTYWKSLSTVYACNIWQGES